ncbi:hypothetical protein EYY60_20715 [Flavobacterium zhairuonense]|uniref:hypothetical protein n=1 Tax=Flavobacterium zhairuonense TaxID=2493631 RepID=UPI00104B3B49|nr:hypothetical protein [Flavobacterium zhairuonense]KAF2506939.1 hypothetical protein EYY60_20715 [Flavobacterium zhairuonense]
MEKISFEPLISELSDKSALYNQWYNEGEIKYGNLDSHSIANWMVEVVEPIVKEVVAFNNAPEKIHEVVKTLYLESLKLIGSGVAIRYNDEYKEAWLLLAQMPNLAVKFPTKTISLLHDVLLNLEVHAPEKTIQWCKLVGNSSSEIKTLEDFKTVGRIYAWKCGLAHLRIRLKSDFEKLSESLQQTIVKVIGSSENAKQIFENPWSENKTKFEGVQGGFIGMTGFFEDPPVLAQIGEYIFATDSKSSYALFADQFGKILLPANTVDSIEITSNSERISNLEKWLGKEANEIDTEAISSVVATPDTLVFTLQNSYFIYLYSLGNA